MRFVASVPDFLGAATVGFGFAVGWAAGNWIIGPILGAIKR